MPFLNTLVGVALLLAGSFVATASAQSPKQLNLAIFAGGLSWPIFVAQDKNFFAKYRLAVALNEVPGSVPQIRGLMEGTYDVAMTPFDNVVAYQEGQGEVALNPAPDLFAFMGGLSGTLRLIVAPDVTTFADLRGRRLGVDAEFTGYTLTMYALLAANGLPSGSYELAKTGGTSFRVKALEDGRIAGTMVSSPQEIGLEARGYRRLGDVHGMLGAYQAVSGTARRSWAAQNADTLRDFIRAYVEASDWLADPANKQEAAAIYARHIAGATEAGALKAWPVMLGGSEGFQPRAKFDAAGAEKVLQIRSNFGRPPKDLRDWNKYVDEGYYLDALKPR